MANTRQRMLDEATDVTPARRRLLERLAKNDPNEVAARFHQRVASGFRTVGDEANAERAEACAAVRRDR